MGLSGLLFAHPQRLDQLAALAVQRQEGDDGTPRRAARPVPSGAPGPRRPVPDSRSRAHRGSEPGRGDHQRGDPGAAARGDDQSAEHRADAHGRGEVAEGLGVAVQPGLCEDG